MSEAEKELAVEAARIPPPPGRKQLPYKVKMAIVWVVIFMVLALLFAGLKYDVPFMAEWTPFILKGVWATLLVSILAICLAIPLALLGALGRLSKSAVAYGISSFYISFIRGTPLLIQIFFWYFAVPRIAKNLPLPYSGWFVWPAIAVGVLALGVNYGAYMTEIFRAGIMSVAHGQREAAEALGMTYRQMMRRVVLPQAMRVIIPPTGNEFIAMLKDSSLVNFIAVQELFWHAYTPGTAYSRGFETLTVAALVYWGLTSIFSFFQARLERRISSGYDRTAGKKKAKKERDPLDASTEGHMLGGSRA